MTITQKAHAKINLYLDVTGKRENGYHDVKTVMQSVSLCDILTVEKTAAEGILLDTGGALPADNSNLIVRAAKRYFAASGARFGIRVTLQKHIPMAAGMGGGSADAAATLRALNELDGNRFTVKELAEMGADIGADVPFCVLGGTALCEGIGEVMTPIKTNLNAALVVAMGGEGVSTPQAFAALDARYRDFVDFESSRSPESLISALQRGSLSDTVGALFNRFEEVVEPQRPAVTEIKRSLLDHGALAAQMSGSGPSVFGIFESARDADRAALALKNENVCAYSCQFTTGGSQ